MKDKKCSFCNDDIKEQKGEKPTWFAKYVNDKIIELICDKCYYKHKGWPKNIGV